MSDAQPARTGHSTLAARFVTFAGVVGLFGAWNWLLVQEAPLSALALAAVAGLVVGSRRYIERRTRRPAAE